MQKVQIEMNKLSISNLGKIVLLLYNLSAVQGVFAECSNGQYESVPSSNSPSGVRLVCREWENKKSSSSSLSSSDSSSGRSSNSQANTQAAIGAVSAIAGVWETQRNERIKRQEQENAQRRTEFNRAVADAENNADTNPWANFTSDKKDKKQDKKQSDIYLGTCVEQNFSSQSNGLFALKNTCDYAINLKYIFSSSKPFSGTYTTLRPNQTTFETGKQGENVKYYMCPVPQTPQSLDGGCI